MISRATPAFYFALLAIALVAGFIGLRQWQETAALRTQLEVARIEIGDLGRLRAENRKLRAAQIPAAQLERLRADHAALAHLRAELDAATGGSGP